MPNDTSTIGPIAYRSHLTRAYSTRGKESRRAAAVDAAVELLHAMALAGKVSSANDVTVAVGPIADAIEQAIDAKKG